MPFFDHRSDAPTFEPVPARSLDFHALAFWVVAPATLAAKCSLAELVR